MHITISLCIGIFMVKYIFKGFCFQQEQGSGKLLLLCESTEW